MADKNPIPKTALNHHIAFLGKTGSAKTGSAKSGIVEPELRAGERVCIFDPTAAWWGLRLAADGKSKGLPIYVFGGDHGDFPLSGNQGEMIAEAIGTSSTSAILDVSMMRSSERMRFFTDFADTILRVNKGPLRLVIDEAHLFAPQAGTRGSGAMPDMLHAANNLISLGRSRGLKIVLISQRPAKVHKDSLTQVETLVAMRLIAPQDRKAIEEWIADQADKETGREIIASLPSLKNGEGWVWAPEAGFLKRVRFPFPTTYDSSKVQAAGSRKKLSPIDVEKLQAQFEKVKEESAKTDPAVLQKRIRELEAEARKKVPPPAPAVPSIDKKQLAALEARALERGRIQGFSDGVREVADKWVYFVTNVSTQFKSAALSLETANVQMQAVLERATKKHVKAAQKEAANKPVSPTVIANTVRTPAPPAGQSQVPRSPSPGASGDGSLSMPEQRIINAIRWWNVFGLPEPTHQQVGFIANYVAGSGTWNRYLSSLRSAGMIESKGPLVLTAAGNAAAAEPTEVPSGVALRTAVMAKIDAPLRKILEPLLAAYPEGMSHEDAAAAAVYVPGSGTWNRYLSALRSLDLIERKGELKAQTWLFP